MTRTRTGFATLVGLLVWPLLVGALEPGPKCEANKLKTAGKYAFCRLKTESKAVRKGTTPDFTKCVSKFSQKWVRIEDRAAGACPTNGDENSMDSFIAQHADEIAQLLSGGALPFCGDGQIDAGEQCDSGDLNGESCASLVSGTSGTLSCSVSCQFDLSGCAADPVAGVIRSGQTICYDVTGTMIPCSGTGHDGDIQAGVARGYTDNGDGTITDNATGLMWEKLSDDESIHDKDNGSQWVPGLAKADDLNTMMFAGYDDWRVPSIIELQTIIDYETSEPAISDDFRTDCPMGCTVLTCNCVRGAPYWSSTSYEKTATNAWFVDFQYGSIGPGLKTQGNYVRAVRGP